EILERHIGGYLKEERLARWRSLWKTIRGAPFLKELFEKHRGQKNLVVPMYTDLRPDDVMLVIEALEVSRELGPELAALDLPEPARAGVRRARPRAGGAGETVPARGRRPLPGPRRAARVRRHQAGNGGGGDPRHRVGAGERVAPDQAAGRAGGPGAAQADRGAV